MSDNSSFNFTLENRCIQTYPYACTRDTTRDSCCKNDIDGRRKTIAVDTSSYSDDEMIDCPHDTCIDWGKTYSNIRPYSINLIGHINLILPVSYTHLTLPTKRIV